MIDAIRGGGMVHLFTLLNVKSVLATEEQLLTVYVPLSSKEIPADQLRSILQGWFNPELGSVSVYLDLDEAIKLQERWFGYERYPNTEALRVIVELQVPSWMMLEDNEGFPRIDLSEADEYSFSNIHVTAKYMAGSPDDVALPGDCPFDGRIQEVIPL